MRSVRAAVAATTLVATAALPAGAEPVDAARLAVVEQGVLDELSVDGTADFWVVLGERADLSGARETGDWSQRGRLVYERLTATARASQGALAAALAAANVVRNTAGGSAGAGPARVERFWISNVVFVRGGSRRLLEVARAQPGVAEIMVDRPVRLPDPPMTEAGGPSVAAVEWGVAAVRADQVWQQFGVTGGGVVIGSIDTGVEHTHPALVDRYRGNLGNGVFDHDYNWWDPARVCGQPSLAPCDNNDHGTHTTGIMVGTTGTGVAPGARWIAAKGCETINCSQASLLSAAQFMLAPTDLTGANPRPELRPHVVNNSWGSGFGGNSPWFDHAIEAWTAAGMFPVASNGNGGPGCQSTAVPAYHLDTFAVGSHGTAGGVSSGSSRGPGGADFEAIKPDVVAPGAAIRSSVRGGGFALKSGTSMAAPHVSGAVALLWSAAPALVGDQVATRQILAGTAVDVANLSCGGQPGNNNAAGEGRLDAYAAVELSPRAPAGFVAGTVTASAGGAPIEGATVTVQVGGRSRVTRTAADGSYRLAVSAGSYHVEISSFGRVPGGGPVTVGAGQTVTVNVALATAPAGSVAGHVRDELGNPVAGAIVTVLDTPLPPAITGSDGGFVLPAVPFGQYQVSAGGCRQTQTHPVVVDAAETVNFTQPPKSDAFGYSCEATGPQWAGTTTELTFADPDAGFATVTLPFLFQFYEGLFQQVEVNVNGFVQLGGQAPARDNTRLPNPALPHSALYAYWDDLAVDAVASVRTGTAGNAPERRFVIEWRNVRVGDDPARRIDVQAVLFEDGSILLQYRNLGDHPIERGGSATVGVENNPSTTGTAYSFNQPALVESLAIRIAA